jgi:hypothetical protein
MGDTRNTHRILVGNSGHEYVVEKYVVWKKTDVSEMGTISIIRAMMEIVPPKLQSVRLHCAISQKTCHIE